MLGDKGRWFKGVQYEGSAHVPLLWKGPKGSKENGGRVVNQVIENTDLMPTILDAAGLPVPEGVQGRSFVKLARGEVMLAAYCCYTERNLDLMAQPRATVDPALGLRTLERLAKLRAGGTRILFGHDGRQWATVREGVAFA